MKSEKITKSSIKKVIDIKGREFSKPIILLVSTIKEIDKVAYIEHKAIDSLLEKYWPGALTIILKKRDGLSDRLTAGGDTIGVRMPSSKIALEIIEKSGGVLAVTSANSSGNLSPVEAEEVLSDIGDKIDFIIDGGRCSIGVESTIVDLSGDEVKVLREGAISSEELMDFFKNV